jgi:hypothetical protein
MKLKIIFFRLTNSQEDSQKQAKAM